MAYAVLRASDGALIAQAVKLANTYWLRLTGLMGRTELPEGNGLWIVPCNSVHSCFMRFVFDAVFIDANNIIVHLLSDMPPWRATALIKGAVAVLELPAGTIHRTNLKIGDTLMLQAAEVSHKH